MFNTLIPVTKEDRYNNLTRTQRNKTRRCDSCHHNVKGTFDTCENVTSKIVKFVANTIPALKGTDMRLALCACCTHIHKAYTDNIVDNVQEAMTDRESPEDKTTNETLEDLFPRTYHTLGSIRSNNKAPKSQDHQSKPRDKPPDGTIKHITELLSAPSPDEDIELDDLTQWYDNPSEATTYVDAKELSSNIEYKSVKIHPISPTDRRNLTKIVTDFGPTFSSKLPKEPAKVTPLQFQLDKTNWTVRQNQEAARRQSMQKDIVIRDMTDELLATDVIETSRNAEAWSQVHLARKPNGKWRYCIDFRRLNMLLQNRGWPLPRIQDLIQRIGRNKPKYFGKIDLTNGYHQMPLAADSRKYTAFRTPQGIYEWKRVPMGIKQAASYFQMQMAQILHDVIGKGVEVYIDDIIIYAQSMGEFQDTLRKVLTKLREHGIVASPTKTELAFPELNILGHTIDENGVKFDKNKLQGALNIEQPTTVTQMQKLLGLTTHFRDHLPAGQRDRGIPDVTDLEKPLRQLITDARLKKTNKLTWNRTAETALPKLQRAIWNCQKLFFYDDTKRVFLHTDASNHGIGAYLFQMSDDGKELPIAFMSKSFDERQSRWSTYEQEAYAIYAAA